MKLLLNTAFDDHFCALFDRENNLVDECVWENKREDARQVWDFLARSSLKKEDITWLGGVSGPGGFASLRATGVIINALDFASGAPIYQARQDVIVKWFLKESGFDENAFLLNSFGDGVFYPEEEKIVRVSVDEAVKIFKNTPLWLGFLPVGKQEKFTDKIPLKFENQSKLCLEVLQRQEARDTFFPDYEYPAVQH